MNGASRAVLVGVVWLALAVATLAHRLDEYLQATRIGIDRSRIDLDIDLTPGVAVAPAILATIDRDGDGRPSSGELAAYAHQVIDAVTLEVDGQRLPVVLTGSSISAVSEVRAGVGAIRLTATARLPVSAPGPHEVRYRNAHRPDTSVYLANALIPQDPDIAITAQHRDAQQRELRVEYRIAARAATWPSLAAGAVATLATGLFWHTRRRGATRVRHVNAL